ncbi:TlpA family protein disulfide reductase [Fulvivirga ligni]|uniref:TlpA family protein disulfide reductase n=1 Tax=Fulvivirga ligni TaxID=2904246 RepID=UPI001F29D65D|nr:TlpA disulfide reductase family protein [Fulvivirga ligni]UII20897.1 TlpA family protein disulfide reductase [Fulvivirga ligni]
MLSLYRFSLFAVLCIAVPATNLCAQQPGEFLQNAINELSQIKNCEYVLNGKDSAPFDTTNFVYSYVEKFQGYRNLEDSVVGYTYKRFLNDTTLVTQVYDGKFVADFNWSKKEVILKDVIIKPEERFVLHAAFYLQVQTLLEYFLYPGRGHQQILWQNSDEGEVDIEKEVHRYKVTADNDSILQIDLQFNSHRIEVQGNLIVVQGRKGYANSTYTVWFDKKSLLPYKLYRKQEHHASIVEIVKSQIGKSNMNPIDALAEIPQNFSIKNERISKPTINIGDEAPELGLRKLDGREFPLQGVSEKVILIDFTSISCGPCHLSLSRLKKIQNEFVDKGFSVISIEVYRNDKDAISKYLKKNSIEYPYLLPDINLLEQYGVQGVPFFVLLDENRIVRSVFTGFSEKNMESIRNKVEELVSD